MTFEYLRIGKIVNTQGIKGEVRVIPLTEDLNRFYDLEYVYLDDIKLVRLEIEYVKFHKNFALLKFKGINDMNQAEKLKENYILIDRKDAIKLPEGSYFVCDILGLSVYDINNCYMGKIIDIISTGSNDVYTVRDNEKEILVPALKSVIKQIDIKEGKVVVDLPEGLI